MPTMTGGQKFAGAVDSGGQCLSDCGEFEGYGGEEGEVYEERGYIINKQSI